MAELPHIMMIEDDAGHATLIQKNIRRAGVAAPIVHKTNGASALEALFTPDGAPVATLPVLILLDINLPDMSGVEVLRRVKADRTLRCVPVVMLTTTDDRAEIQRCYEHGCNVYITKPVNYQDFAAAIRQLGVFLTVIQVPESTPV